MEGEASYEKMAELVDSIDSARPEAEATIDLSDVFSSRLAVKKVAYRDAGRMLEQVKIKPEIQQPAQQPQQPRVQTQVQKRETRNEMAGAAASLRNMVAGAEKEFAESVTKKMEEAEEAKLAMPKLSLQDQLSDLEKIREGLEENVFDNTQIKIIKEEMKGMTQILSREDVSKMGDDQRELTLMRNQRIKEIKGRLNTS